MISLASSKRHPPAFSVLFLSYLSLLGSYIGTYTLADPVPCGMHTLTQSIAWAQLARTNLAWNLTCILTSSVAG